MLSRTTTVRSPVYEVSTVEEIKDAIRHAIAQANAERELLAVELAKKERSPYYTVDRKIIMRLELWEQAQDTLWEWLKHKNAGKARLPG